MSASFHRAVNVLKKMIDTPIASYFNSCLHCGLCAEACLFYTETGDPKYAPIYKLEPLRRLYQQEYTLMGRMARLFGLSRPVTATEFEDWKTLVYDSCTLCGRCSLVCPTGNDIVSMVKCLREGMAIAGHAPQGMIDVTKRTLETGSPMGITWSALQRKIENIKTETGLEIPLNQEGAEYMLVISSLEIAHFPGFLTAVSKIMRQAKKTWTLCSDAFEASNSGVHIGVSDIAKEIVSRIVAGAEKLRVKTVISSECGHAFTALRWDGPNLIERPYRFRVRHIVEVLDEFRKQGLLQTIGHEEARLTFHDPCQLARMGGVLEPQRKLLKMVASDFVEMPDSGEYNWCCGGGGGVSDNEDAKELRLVAFTRKRAQLEAVNARRLVTACANCRIVLGEGMQHHQMNVPLLGLTELIANYLLETTAGGTE